MITDACLELVGNALIDFSRPHLEVKAKSSGVTIFFSGRNLETLGTSGQNQAGVRRCKGRRMEEGTVSLKFVLLGEGGNLMLPP